MSCYQRLRTHYAFGTATLLLALAASGCSNDDGRPETVGQTSAADIATTLAVRPDTDTIVAQPIHWNAPVLTSSLRSAGFNPVAILPRDARRFAEVPAAAFRLGEAEVEAYFFGDQLAAARARPRVPTDDPHATAFTSNNMLVVLRTQRQALRDRVRRALTKSEVRGTSSP